MVEVARAQGVTRLAVLCRGWPGFWLAGSQPEFIHDARWFVAAVERPAGFLHRSAHRGPLQGLRPAPRPFLRRRSAESSLEVLDPKHQNRVYVAMGSSGEKQFVLEAVRALVTGEFNAVVAVPPAICPLDEIAEALTVPDNVYLTDQVSASRRCQSYG